MWRSLRTLAAIGAAAALLAACGGGAATTSSAAGATSTPATTPTPAPRPSGTATCDSPQPRPGGYSAIDCTVAAPSLANNKLGDDAEVSMSVVLPPSYDGSTRRYPVVYMLAGYGERVSGIDLAFASALDHGARPDLIVVLVSGETALGGSFYVNSRVSGNWEDAIANDLVGYVDAHYRTVAEAKSRGVAGTSMGGFGALSLAMRRADTFGAVYAMSPGLFDPDGAEARLGKEQIVSEVLQNQRDLAGSAVDAAKVLEAADLGGDDLQFEYAYGVAFAPDPSSPILMQFPYRLDAGKPMRDAAIWKTWEAGYGGLPDKVRQYGAALKSLRGIALDYGTNDAYAWIPNGCKYFAKLLGDAKIQVTVNAHEGGHDNVLDDRMRQFMLPFMSQKLASS